MTGCRPHRPHSWPRRPARRVTLAQVAEHVAWEYGIEQGDVIGLAPRFARAEPRCAFVWLARRHTEATGADLAGVLLCHLQTTVTLHRIARELMHASGAVRDRFDRLNRALEACATLPVGEAA